MITNRTGITAALFTLAGLFLPLSATGQAPMTAEPLPNRYIVVLKPEVVHDVSATARDFAERYDGRILRIWTSALKGFWVELAPDAASLAAQDQRVALFEEDALLTTSSSDAQPTDAESVADDPEPWHLWRISHRLPRSLEGQDPRYRDLPQSNDGAGVTVYIIDSGVDRSHQEFSRDGNVILNLAGSNQMDVPDKLPYVSEHYVPPDYVPPDSADSDNPCGGGKNLRDHRNAWHGTAVASMVVGKSVGVAKGVTVVPVKAISCVTSADRISTATLINAFDWIAITHKQRSGPAVISISTYRSVSPIGDFDYCRMEGDRNCVVQPDLGVLETTIENVIVGSGIPVIASANNQDNDACLTVPARLSMRSGRGHVIVVGGTDDQDKRYQTLDDRANPGSNYGQCVDLWAPAKLLKVAEAGTTDKYWVDHNSGTSFSAPMVAGIAARLFAALPGLWCPPGSNSCDPGETANHLYEALKVNATPIYGDAHGLGTASPNLLAYAAGVTFIAQPQSRVAEEGAEVSLSVKIAEPITEYDVTWYRGEAGDVNGSTVVGTGASYDFVLKSAPVPNAVPREDRPGKYWARLTASATPTLFGDSVAAEVSIGSCPVILSQPNTQWATSRIGPFTLNATVESSVPYCWKWCSVPAWDGYNPDAKPAREPIEHGESSPGTEPVPLPISSVLDDVTTYQLVVDAGACPSEPPTCGRPTRGAESDTAQIRVCTPPKIESFQKGERTYDAFSTDPEENKPLSVQAAGKGLQYLWRLDGQPVRLTTENGWELAHRSTFWPQTPGRYSVDIGNDCGMTSSDTIEVRQDGFCDFDLKGSVEGALGFIGYIRGRNDINETEYPIRCNSSATLRVEAEPGTGAPAREVQYSWSGLREGETGSGPNNRTTAPITEDRSITVTAFDPQTSCQRVMTFALLKCPTVGFTAAAGEVPEPPADPSTGESKAVAQVEVKTSNGGRLTSPVTVSYRTDQRSALAGLDFRSTSGTLTFSAGSESGSTKTIEVSIIDDVSVESNEDFDIVLFNAVNASNGPDAHTVTIRSDDVGTRRRACCGRAAPNPVNPGGTVTLAPPETSAGYTYEWRTGSSYDSSDAPFSTSASPTRQIFETTHFWVRTHTPEGETIDSDLIEVLVAPPSEIFVIAEPAGYVLPGNPVKLTASDPNGTCYEWRRGPRDPGYDVISDQRSVTVTPRLDTQYWVRVFYGSDLRDSAPFTVRVCNYPTVVARAGASGPYAAYNGTINLFAFGSGDDVSFTWYEGEAGDTSSQLGSGPSLRAFISHPVEKFWVRGVDRCGQLGDSRTVEVYRCLPTITQQPEGRLLAPGQTAALTVAAIGGDGQPLPDSAYKWYRSDDVYQQQPLATGASYTPPAVAAAATYYAALSVTCNGQPHVVRSGEATLERCASPVIVSSSGGYYITSPGQSATIGVYAEGTDLTYQWYEGTAPGGTPISEATSWSLTVAPQNTTSYWCRVTSQGLCSIDTPTLPVTVCRTPVIDTPPASRRIFQNTSTTLGVVAHEVTNTPETYQWSQRSGSSGWTDIPGATSTSYTTPLLSNETEYRVRVSAGLCSITSPTATISLCTYPEVLTVSKDRNVSSGDAVTLKVNDIAPVVDKYVTWFQGASGVRTMPLASGLNRTLFVAPTATTQYWAEVEHLGCVSRTSTITVNVCIPKITADPVGRAVAAGTSTTLTVGAGGASGLTYQWYKGQPGDVTQPIAGATSSSLSVSPTSTTSYWAHVTGTCGSSADSAAATITVCAAPVIHGTNGPTVYTRAGTPASLSVSATGNNLGYQWHNGPSGTISPIAEATSAYHSVSPAATASYWVRVSSDGVCFANSGTITVDVCSNPSITVQPQPKVIRTGQATTLSVTASSSTGSLTYQWYQGASGNASYPIAGATSSSYTTPTLTADTSYWVRVTRGACSTDSAAAMVTVCKITASPWPNVNSASGQPVNIAVGVYNSRVAQPTVTWYAGASGNTSTPVLQGPGLVQTTVAPVVTTSYWARVNDGTCTADSNAMTVNVCKPTITTQPASVLINSGQSTTLSAAASGAPLTYQWYAGESGVATSPIAGATGPSLTVAPATTTSYLLRASGCAGAIADSATATVTVCAPPTITQQPANAGPVSSGTLSALSVSATGTNLTYQWYRGEKGVTTQPVGEPTETLVLRPDLTEKYWVRISGLCGVTDSNAAFLSVYPTLTTQPADATIASGSTATLSVAAYGKYLSYQWYTSTGTPIAGATSASYTTPPLTANAGYFVAVRSGVAQRESRVATIKICQGPRIVSGPNVTYFAGCQRQLKINIDAADQPTAQYMWYRGEKGDTSQLLSFSSFFTVCIVEPTKYWVRISNGTCATDSQAVTVNP